MAFKRTVAAATLATAVLAKDVPLEQAKQRLQAVKDKAAKVDIAEVWKFNDKFYAEEADPKVKALEQAVRFAKKVSEADTKFAEAKKQVDQAEKQLKKAQNKDNSAKASQGAASAAKNKVIKTWVEASRKAVEELAKQTEAAEKLAVSEAAVTKASGALQHSFMKYSDAVDVTSEDGNAAYWAPQQRMKDAVADFTARKQRFAAMKKALQPESTQVAGLINAMEALADAKKQYKKVMVKSVVTEQARKDATDFVQKEGDKVNKKALAFVQNQVLLQGFAKDLSNEQQDVLLGLGDALARIAGTEVASGPKGGSAKVKKENAHAVKKIFADLLEAVVKAPGSVYADLLKSDKALKTLAQWQPAAAKAIKTSYMNAVQAAMSFKGLVHDVKNLHQTDAPALPEPTPETPAAAQAPEKSGMSMGVVAAIAGVVVVAVLLIAICAYSGSSEGRRSRR